MVTMIETSQHSRTVFANECYIKGVENSSIGIVVQGFLTKNNLRFHSFREDISVKLLTCVTQNAITAWRKSSAVS